MSLRPLMTACGLLLATVAAGAVLAQAPHSSAPANPMAGMIRFAGTVASAHGDTFVIHSRQGGDLTLTLPSRLNIMVSNKGTLADLDRGKFVGCTAVKRADHLLHATECHIFPESMRGMGEGHNPMGPPNQTMTNGNVETIAKAKVKAKSGGARAGTGVVLKVAYKGGEQTIQVGPDADITQIGPGTPEMVRPGVKVAGAARPGAQGTSEVVFLSLTP